MRKCLHLLPDSSSTDGPTLLVCEVNGVDHILEILTSPLSLGQQICSVIITGWGGGDTAEAQSWLWNFKNLTQQGR